MNRFFRILCSVPVLLLLSFVAVGVVVSVSQPKTSPDGGKIPEHMFALRVEDIAPGSLFEIDPSGVVVDRDRNAWIVPRAEVLGDLDARSQRVKVHLIGSADEPKAIIDLADCAGRSWSSSTIFSDYIPVVEVRGADPSSAEASAK